jgi:hypothetical protein
LTQDQSEDMDRVYQSTEIITVGLYTIFITHTYLGKEILMSKSLDFTSMYYIFLYLRVDIMAHVKSQAFL